MTLVEFTNATLDLVKSNQAWAAPIVFALAFGESLAFLSLLLPATVILVGLGGLLGAVGVNFAPFYTTGPDGINFWPIVIAGWVGSVVGYGISYWLGKHYKDEIGRLWPFSKYPEMLPAGKAFFDKWGAFGVFLGHFFGPVRAVIPVVAGMYELKPILFWSANIASSLLWAFGVMAPGAFGIKSLAAIFH
jgi:membrane protein DedA with SNARE-associated domain